MGNGVGSGGDGGGGGGGGGSDVELGIGNAEGIGNGVTVGAGDGVGLGVEVGGKAVAVGSRVGTAVFGGSEVAVGTFSTDPGGSPGLTVICCPASTETLTS